jgi:predicted nucleic acid-binding protein
VLAFIAAHPLEQLYVSAVTFAEIRFGIELVADTSRRAELNNWLAHKVRPMFEERVLPVTEDVMFKWRLLVEEGRKAGHTFSQPELLQSLHLRSAVLPQPCRRPPRPSFPLQPVAIQLQTVRKSGHVVSPVRSTARITRAFLLARATVARLKPRRSRSRFALGALPTGRWGRRDVDLPFMRCER